MPFLTEHWNVSSEKSCPPKENGLGHYECLTGGTCAIIWRECCVFLSDESVNVSPVSNHMRTFVKSLGHLTSSLMGVSKLMVWIMGLLVEKLFLILGIIILICVFSCMCLHFCSGLCVQCSQRATKGATSMLIRPFAECSGHIMEEGT